MANKAVITQNGNERLVDKSKYRRLRAAGGSVLAAALWLAVWQLVSAYVDRELLLPKPLTVLYSLLDICVKPEFWRAVFASLLRVLAGFLTGAAAGVVLGALTNRFRLADILLSPVLRIIRATPVASFIILAILWIKSSYLPAFISMLMVMPVIWGNVYEGISSTDTGLLEVGQVYRFGNFKKLRLIYIPSVAPYFRAGAISALGMAWKSGIAAEVICQPKISIGRSLYYSKLYLETPELFAWTAVVIILSIIVEKALVGLLKKLP